MFAVLAAACAGPPPAPSTPPPAPTPAVTPSPTRPLAVAVAVGTPTATIATTGDYRQFIRPSLLSARDGLKRLEGQLAAAQKTPMLMAQDDWRTQTQAILEQLFQASGQLKAIDAQVSSSSPLRADVAKFADDLEFVADEFRMALEYDPDASHILRAVRAEKSTSAELDSLLAAV